MRRYRRSMRRRRRSMWRRLHLGQRRRRSCGGHSMRRYRRSMRRRRRAATSTITRSYRRYRRGVSGDIGDCGVGITPQMCNRVTNHGDMSTFSKPEVRQYYSFLKKNNHNFKNLKFVHSTFIIHKNGN